MPTIMTHAVVGLGLGAIATSRPMTFLYWGMSAGLAMLPDIDVLAFAVGIRYGSFLGHRGFVHSLLFAALAGLVTALATAGALGVHWYGLWLYFSIVTASHGILDGFTNGGLGIAYFSPVDTRRYFFPWQPIQVSPLGTAFFSAWGVRVLKSEFVWVWLPTAALVAAVLLVRRAG